MPRICAMPDCENPTRNQDTKFCGPVCYTKHRNRAPVRFCANCGERLRSDQSTACSMRCQGILSSLRQRSYTDAHLAHIRRLRDDGVSLEAIAAETGLTPEVVYRAIHRHHIIAPKLWYNADQDTIIRARYTTYDSIADIVVAVNRAGPRQTTAKTLAYRAHTLKVKRPANYHARTRAPSTYAKERAKPVVVAPKQAPVQRGPEAVPARVIRQWGFTLGLPPALRGDVEAVSLAYRRQEDPTHPGFRLSNGIAPRRPQV